MSISDTALPFVVIAAIVVIICVAKALAMTAKKKEEAQREQQKAQREKREAQSAPSRPLAPKKQPVTRGPMHSEMKSNLKKSPTPTLEAKHTHPAEKGSFKVERAYVEGDSSPFTEGCEEHYYERFISMPTASTDSEQPNAELARLMVLGECLSKPKYKNPLIRYTNEK